MHKTFSTTCIINVLLSVCLIIVSACQFKPKATRSLLQAARQKAPYDVIIVPGIQFKNGQWDRVMKGRIYWAKYLYDEGIARNIILSGSAVHTPYYEAQVMALYAKAVGIPEENILLELKAEHSTENAYYGYKLAKQQGFHKIALASDPFQTRMLRKFIRKKVSKEIDLIPFVVDTLQMLEPAMTDPVIDYQLARAVNFIPLKERESFFKRWRGTIRGNMDTSAYR